MKVKSSNRVLQSMALGLIPVVSRVPAYEEVIENGVNGFFLEKPIDLVNYIKKLDSLASIHEMKLKAYLTAKRYELSTVINRWVELLEPSLILRKEDNSIGQMKGLIYAKLARYDRRFVKKIEISSLGFGLFIYHLTCIYLSAFRRKIRKRFC